MSLGSTIPPQFRPHVIPGQIPDRKTMREIEALTAMPSGKRMKWAASERPYFSASRVVDGLGLNKGQQNDWARHIAKAMMARNELLMRQDLMSKMFEEKLDSGLRRELFARSMSLWKQGQVSKSVDVVSAGVLLKAGPFIGPKGGKWKDAAHTIPYIGPEKPERISEATKVVDSLIKLVDNPNPTDVRSVMINAAAVARESGAETKHAILKAVIMFSKKAKLPPASMKVVASALKVLTKEAKKERLKKSGPFIGPRGGKWADPKHAIPWKEPTKKGKRSKVLPAERLKGKTDTREQYGVKWETGKPATFTFSRSLEAAPKFRRGMEDRFQQRVEPAGRYMIQVSSDTKALPNHIVDEITFKKPLVLKSNSREPLGGYDDDSWKMNLSRAFGGKKGKALSAEVAKAGFDGIVTTGKHGTSEIVDLRFLHTGILEKAEPRGGTYVKRTPKPGGGWRYFYDEDKYNMHEGAHVSGEEAATTAITRAVAGHVKAAGEAGCELKTLHPLVKRYGAKLVGGMLNDACGSGAMRYVNGRLFPPAAKGKAKAEKKLEPTKASKRDKEGQVDKKMSKAITQLNLPTREDMLKQGLTLDKDHHPKYQPQDNSIFKGNRFVIPDGDTLQKAGPHKYVRRVPKPGGEEATADKAIESVRKAILGAGSIAASKESQRFVLRGAW